MKGHKWGKCPCGKNHGPHPLKGRILWGKKSHPRKGVQSSFMKERHRKLGHPMKGKKHTAKTKRKMSAALKGKKRGTKRPDLVARNKSLKNRLAVSKALSGRKKSKEHVEKMRLRMLGRKRGEKEIERWLRTNKKGGLWERHAERLRKEQIAKYCKSPSKPQLEMFKHLQKVFHFTEVICNHPFPKKGGVGNYYLDVAIPEFKLNFEYDGAYWHRYTKKKDAERDEYLKSKGWMVIRIEGE